MKTSKRLLALVLCVLALCTSIVIVHAVEERGPVLACPFCDNGSVTTSTDIINHHYEYPVCAHGTGGADVYECYTVVTTHSCDSCSYSESSYEDVENFLYCAGAGNR